MQCNIMQCPLTVSRVFRHAMAFHANQEIVFVTSGQVRFGIVSKISENGLVCRPMPEIRRSQSRRSGAKAVAARGVEGHN